MKIAIIGYSGSGKSTLARKLSQHYDCDVLHLDSIRFAPGWVERSSKEMTDYVRPFMDEKESWIIDGNYQGVLHQRRLDEADKIIILDFNRFSCLWRAFKRYHTYKGKTRPDMGQGCSERLDWDFVRWILWEGRNKQSKRFRRIEKEYSDKVIVLKNQRQLDKFI